MSSRSLSIDRDNKASRIQMVENVDKTPPSAPSWTEEEEKKLVRKIDLRLLPTIWLMYLLSYMDRTKYAISILRPQHLLTHLSIGNAKIAGMADDLHLTSAQYSIVLVVFFGKSDLFL